MDAIEAILSRRSIRKYLPKLVTNESIQQILQTAMNAPSAGNARPWHFIVITDQALLRQIPRFHPYSNMLNHCPVAIAVCADLDLERYRGFWVQDCSAAIENMLIASNAMGLGAVWLGIYPIEERVDKLKTLLKLPRNIIPLALVALGYPIENIKPINRFDPSRIHRNVW